ncbi:hypothetical protein [Mesonia sp.]|uniref:hypothetical protein n=1 Tax=Mesonia sp. TaxID=1960830 RepID=UPI003F983FE8
MSEIEDEQKLELKNEALSASNDEKLLKGGKDLMSLDNYDNKFLPAYENDKISGKKDYSDDYLSIYDDYEDIEGLKKVQAERRAAYWEEVFYWALLLIVSGLLIFIGVTVFRKKRALKK